MTAFIILLAISVIPASIAKSKGRSFLLWYIYAVCLWIVALIHSIVLKEDTSATTRESITGVHQKRCPFCSEFIPMTATVCRYCGRDLSTPINTETESISYTPQTNDSPATNDSSNNLENDSNLEEQLTKLKNLFEKKLIDESEYKQKKEKLLGL